MLQSRPPLIENEIGRTEIVEFVSFSTPVVAPAAERERGLIVSERPAIVAEAATRGAYVAGRHAQRVVTDGALGRQRLFVAGERFLESTKPVQRGAEVVERIGLTSAVAGLTLNGEDATVRFRGESWLAQILQRHGLVAERFGDERQIS